MSSFSRDIEEQGEVLYYKLDKEAMDHANDSIMEDDDELQWVENYEVEFKRLICREIIRSSSR